MRTFHDQIEFLQASYPTADGARAMSIMRLAVHDAYNDIGTMHRWNYLSRRTQINTVASQQTGSIEYDAATRVATLSGASWPSWAKYGSIVISANIYKIESVDGADATLVADRSPVVDFAAGTAYVLYRDQYHLPPDFLKRQEMVQTGRVWRLNYIEPTDTAIRQQWQWTPNTPWAYTIRGDQYGNGGTYAIEFIPPPSEANTYDLTYAGLPRQRTLRREYSTGSVSVSGTTVTGTATAFTSDMVGCVIRFGDTEHIPTSEFGEYFSRNEQIVASVESATSLTLKEPATTASGVYFIIDDPVDLPGARLYGLFDRLCESQWETRVRSDSRAGTKDREKQAFREALAAETTVDSATLVAQTQGPFMPFPSSVLGPR